MTPLLWITLGSVIGGIVGWAVPCGLGVYLHWQNPTQADAFSVAIVGIFTIPAGLLIGGLLGSFIGISRK
jgi:ethanolamine transporter EutH